MESEIDTLVDDLFRAADEIDPAISSYGDSDTDRVCGAIFSTSCMIAACAARIIQEIRKGHDTKTTT